MDMGNNKRTRIRLISAFGLTVGLFNIATAQLPTLTTSLDKKELLIGEQATLKVKVNFPDNGYTVAWFAPPDSLPHFELVQAGNIDTLRSNGTVQLEQTLVFTSFDSGKWKTPPLAVTFQQQGLPKPLTLRAETISYTVGFMPDSTADIRDIKPIIDAGAEKGWPWRLFLLIGLGAAAVLAVLVWLLYKWIRRGAAKTVIVGSQSAYQQVMQQLTALQSLNLALPSECRLYHTRLSQLFKAYMGHKLGVALTNKTTGDTLLAFKDAQLPQAMLASAGAALRGCDAVKFAKFMPDVDQCVNWFNDIKNMIEQVEKQPVLQA
jgi:hypothetical protein